MSELHRRLVHAAGTGLPGLYLVGELWTVGVDWRELQLLLLVGSLLALGLEAVRIWGYIDWEIFRRLTRDYEQQNLAGYALYLFGMTTVALCFDPQVGVPAMLMLSIGDPISGVLSSGELAKQSWVLLVMFAVCLAIAGWFVPPVVAVLGALAATLADGYKPVVRTHVIDDNLTIPIGAALVMTLGLAYLPALARALL